MFFCQRDELAINTVASAAYRIIRDLKSHRGDDELGDQFRNALFFIIQDDLSGTLPRVFSENNEFMTEIRKLASRYRISDSSKLEDITVSVSVELAREW